MKRVQHDFHTACAAQSLRKRARPRLCPTRKVENDSEDKIERAALPEPSVTGVDETLPDEELRSYEQESSAHYGATCARTLEVQIRHAAHARPNLVDLSSSPFNTDWISHSIVGMLLGFLQLCLKS